MSLPLIYLHVNFFLKFKKYNNYISREEKEVKKRYILIQELNIIC